MTTARNRYFCQNLLVNNNYTVQQRMQVFQSEFSCSTHCLAFVFVVLTVLCNSIVEIGLGWGASRLILVSVYSLQFRLQQLEVGDWVLLEVVCLGSGWVWHNKSASSLQPQKLVHLSYPGREISHFVLLV